MKKKWNNHIRERNPFQLLFLFLLFSLTVILAVIFCNIPEKSSVIEAGIVSMQNQSGVNSPVTAVLLNFRGYDTLLEVMVLLVAVIGVWSLTKATSYGNTADISPVQLGVVHLLTPVMCLVAAYLVWQGSHLAGGAFQGGAILGAAGVLLLVSEIPWPHAVPALVLRIGLVFGPLIFTGIALYCLWARGGLLDYPKGSAGWLILLIETTCALSIGLTLALLFAGGRPDETGSEGDVQ
ncbi:MnhB-like protein, subunit of Na+/H+ antiporter [Desulfocapsa sulfexigens DSM 10523]|uniref:MnhB-like protein, subunit of Na+/H+ antiporter n=1 Tax=Desulfocapsa sulfexigens (strain DSM 10523 / SB164P1) TaxID=1167006 RepID=M1NIP1_DESSD|nr:Na(+)/H(+) antiporter subunit B [Desulfocapsa sulfexigens]AGF79434.1 MnhB-like protein, subunit of Na+/H+ antiporter [Desulfocapsa sulfexigens DSM 10523]